MHELGGFYQGIEGGVDRENKLRYVELQQRLEFFPGKDAGGAISYIGNCVDNRQVAESLKDLGIELPTENKDPIYDLTGFKHRFQANIPEGASREDAMATAVRDVVELASLAAGWRMGEVERVVVPTTVAHKEFAHEVVDQVLQINAEGYTISCGCSATPLGFEYISRYPEKFSGKKTVVAPVEILTPYVIGKSEEQLFGDVAAAFAFIPDQSHKVIHAVHKEFTDPPEMREILQIKTDYVVQPDPGSIIEESENGLLAQYPKPPDGARFGMNGGRVYEFVLNNGPYIVKRVVKEAGIWKAPGLTLPDIDFVAGHNFNGSGFRKIKRGKIVRRPLQKRLGVDEPEFYWCSEDTGNAGAASSLFVYLKGREAKMTRPGGKVVIAGYGVGPLTAAAILEDLRTDG